jgi:CelD/BcsL family acetyltransferase involved in cellulose biosynthesis
MVKVERLQTMTELESLRPVWNDLAAAVPFRQWQWLHSWWETFQERGELYVLRVSDSTGRVIGIAPWFLEKSLTRGRRLLQLGSGKVCSDYQSLLVDQQHLGAASEALVHWLIQACESRDDAWDEMDMEAIADGDAAMVSLADGLRDKGLAVDWRAQVACWAVQLPDRWETFVRSLSSSGMRRKLSRLKRHYVDTGRVVMRRAETSADVQRYYGDLVDLHQRRWTDKQQDGCFADQQFTSFLRQAALRLHDAGQLLLSRLEVDGKLSAASFCVTIGRECSMYQCGMDPGQSAHEPGWLQNVVLLSGLIEQGYQTCDYLRGDERYKVDLGSHPRRQSQLRVAAPHSLARLRHQAWLTGDWLRDWGDQIVGTLRG